MVRLTSASASLKPLSFYDQLSTMIDQRQQCIAISKETVIDMLREGHRFYSVEDTGGHIKAFATVLISTTIKGKSLWVGDLLLPPKTLWHNTESKNLLNQKLASDLGTFKKLADSHRILP